jgi:Pectate lyase superfamily protein/Chaperone of endosialidase
MLPEPNDTTREIETQHTNTTKETREMMAHYYVRRKDDVQKILSFGHTTAGQYQFNTAVYEEVEGALPTGWTMETLVLPELNQTTFATATGTANSYLVQLSPAPAQLSKGLVVEMQVSQSNTGGSTLNVNGLGAYPIEKLGGLPLDTNDLRTGQVVSLVFDGSAFQLQSAPMEGLVNASRFGAKGNGIADDSDALQAAIDAAANKTLFIPAGRYRITKELLINAPMMIQGAGSGAGYFNGNDLDNVGGTILIASDPDPVLEGSGRTPGDQRYIKTRSLYRGSATDPEDAPLSTLINIQYQEVTLRDVMVLCQFDPNNNSPTHYGADWDVGVFIGCRVRCHLDKVAVLGYWREAGVYYDVTRGSGLPEFKTPNTAAMAKPNTTFATTIQRGCDGCTLSNSLIRGGKWGVRAQGPTYKPGTALPGWKMALSGTLTFSGQPVENDTITLNGVVITFKNDAQAPSEVDIGPTLDDTLTNLVTWLRDDTRTFTIRRADYEVDGNQLQVLQNNEGTLLTSYTLASGSAAVTVSGPLVGPVADPALFWNGTALVSDRRGAVGFSDFLVLHTAIFGTDHHSDYRRNDIAPVPNVNTDTAGGCVWIDGGCANGYARIHNHTFVRCRFATFEPFMVRLGRSARDTFIACHFEHRQSGGRKDTAGNILPSGKDASQFYGPIALYTGYNRPLKTKMIACDQTPYPEYYSPSPDSSILGDGAGLVSAKDVVAKRSVRAGQDVTGNEFGTVRITGGKDTGSAAVLFGTRHTSFGCQLRYYFGSKELQLRPGGDGLGSTTYNAFALSEDTVNNRTQLNLSPRTSATGAVELLMTSTLASGGNTIRGNSEVELRSATNFNVRLRSGSTTRFTCETTSNRTYVSLLPNVDNSLDLGSSSARYRQFYAANSTINTSDGRYKTEVVASPLGLGFVNALRPVQYRWADYSEMVPNDTTGELEAKSFSFRRPHYGLIAQEVKAAMTASGVGDAAFYVYDPASDRYGLRYSELIAPLIKAVQELSAQVVALQAQVDSMATP